MKRVGKLIIIAAALALGGITAFIIGMSMLGWNFKKLDVTEYTAKVYQTSDAVETVKLDVASFPVSIRNGEEMKLDYYEATNSEVSVVLEDGVLHVTEESDFNPFVTGLFNLGRADHPYVLTVPHGVELNLSGGNGNIKFADSELGNVTIDISNLDATFDNCTIGDLSLHANNLDLEMRGSKFTGVTVNSANCDAEISNCGGESIYIDSTNLNVEFADIGFKAVTVTSTNADIDINTATAEKIDLEAVNADISLVKAKVDKLTVDSINLDAVVEIVGNRAEYTIVSHGNDLPSEQTGTTDKTVVISGTNNDVELRFIGE